MAHSSLPQPTPPSSPPPLLPHLPPQSSSPAHIYPPHTQAQLAAVFPLASFNHAPGSPLPHLTPQYAPTTSMVMVLLDESLGGPAAKPAGPAPAVPQAGRQPPLDVLVYCKPCPLPAPSIPVEVRAGGAGRPWSCPVMMLRCNGRSEQAGCRAGRV